MKIIQLREDIMFRDTKEVERWLNKHYIENYTINEDLTVDVDGCVTIDGSRFGLSYLPVKFNRVTEDFSCKNCSIASSFGFPNYSESIEIANCPNFTSLKNFNKDVKECVILYCNTPIQSNVLNLLMVKNLRKVVRTGLKFKWQEVINKFLPNGDIMSCQDALLDAGLIEYAKL